MKMEKKNIEKKYEETINSMINEIEKIKDKDTITLKDSNKLKCIKIIFKN